MVTEKVVLTHRLGIGLGPEGMDVELVWQEWTSSDGSLLTFRRRLPPQWINCDLGRFDYSVLSKFHAIMADPPWDIHMSVSSLISCPQVQLTRQILLAYIATLWDYYEMRAMPIPGLQDEGLLFLWVTGHAMEVGRECMGVWGYVSPGQKIANYSLILILIGTLARIKSYGQSGIVSGRCFRHTCLKLWARSPAPKCHPNRLYWSLVEVCTKSFLTLCPI